MKRIHLIGVCGTAMATLAAMLKRRGFDVQGSDQDVYPPMSDFLQRENIRVFSGYRRENIDEVIDTVVVGNAISRGNVELEEVLDRKIRYVSLPEAIREHFLWGARSIVIAGTHGKTTTTSLTGWLLTSGGLDPNVLVGGIARNFGEGGSSYRLGQGRDFVIEGDEYDSAFFDKTAKFLKYLPDICVVNNVEFDHADIYVDMAAVTLAFRRLVNLIPRRGLLLLGIDSPAAAELQSRAVSRVETFGTSDAADWQAHDLVPHGSSTRFQVRRHRAPFGSFEVPLVGAHNVRNALAAIAVATEAGMNDEQIGNALRSFEGVKRRLEVIDTVDGVTVYDDFAHHPTAVAETLAGLRASAPGMRIWAVFEPRSASSCRRVFQDDFAAAFAGADEVILAPIFRSTLPEAERLSISRLVADLQSRGASAREAPSVDAILDILVRERRPNDQIVIMSNGGFGGIHRRLVEALRASAHAR
ncbi:MAG TPA: UDP-N-acetylmuramate:L-alanyl-gamma-D-glutamyl-meso-diaminopimelate ligase [Vicinamibacterales bacterium]|jgi:UDP-N-acetylmuramate: L-alanyl-gamma-D-glutamyl-meso-diaminopimelate ligase|nr:UDP-N-acetylmuramate:L-alanyl-gamma-D-glutamyl-meso-diaminopimelate ligase [Vicinamibacterales bacterium]